MKEAKNGVALYATWVLQFLGFYIKDFTKIAIIKLILMLISLHMITLGLWGHLFHFLQYNNFVYEFLADDIAGILSSYVAFYIQVSFVVMAKECRILLHDLGNFGEYDVPDGYFETLYKFDTYFKYMMRSYYVAIVGIVLFLLNRTCEDGVENDCGLVIIAHFPFDIFYTPARQIFMVLQMYSGFGSGLSALSVVVVMIFVMQSLGIQIRHLGKLLMEIAGLETRELRKLQIKKCVLYHYRILGLHKRAANISETIFFIFVFLTSVIMSLTSYQLIAVKMDAVTFIHLNTYFVGVLITCIFGEKFIQESQNLCFTIYDAVPWDSDYQTARDLYIIMMASSKELSLPAGKFGPVGHVRFMMAMKASYSLLTLLLNTK